MKSILLATAASLAFVAPTEAADPSGEIKRASHETIIVTAKPRSREQYHLPTKTESVTAEKITDTVNAVNTEDALKYLPNVLVRKRHIGDTQAPITTRTSGVGASARSLIYADGVLLSALIGNNNGNASPRWSMVAPEEITHIDVMYGPFAAAYAGNSIGSVVEITTRMPEHFEANAQVQGALQSFSQYGTRDDYGTYQLSAGVGDKFGKLSARLAFNHLDSHSQPLAYVTATRPASPSGAGTPVTGAFATLNRTGAPIVVLGAGGLEHQMQDNITAKLALDITPGLRLAYMLGVFVQDNDADVETYLRDASGNPVFPSSVNIGGYNYSVPASAFANNIYSLKQAHVMQSLALRWLQYRGTNLPSTVSSSRGQRGSHALCTSTRLCQRPGCPLILRDLRREYLFLSSSSSSGFLE